MKRDMDLVREILRTVEKMEPSRGHTETPFEIDGYSPDLISYHLKLMIQANLVEATAIREARGGLEVSHWWIKGLTWDGHDFLDSARDESRWNVAKGILTEKVGTIDRLRYPQKGPREAGL